MSEQGIGNENIVIALQRSLNEALTRYKTLQLNFLSTDKLVLENKLCHGDYSTAAKVIGKDELAHLGNVLSNMRDAIASSQRKVTITGLSR